MSYARLTQRMKRETPGERTVKCCPPRGGWQLTRLASALGAVQCQTHALRQSGAAAEASVCVKATICRPNFRVEAVLTLLYKNSNTILSRKRHPTPSKDMISGLNQTYHSERAELAPWRVDQRSSVPPTNNLCHPLHSQTIHPMHTLLPVLTQEMSRYH